MRLRRVGGEGGTGPAAAAAALAALTFPPPGAVPASTLECLWHPADVAVKPIVMNRRIEAWPEHKWDPAAVPFRTLALPELLAAHPAELEAFVGSAVRALAHGVGATVGGAPPQSVAASLGYLESLAPAPGAANLIVNSGIAGGLVKLLRSARGTAVRCRAAALLGALIRHATFLSDDLAATGILQLLVEQLRDAPERLRRRCTATLGELLFYVATQATDAAAAAQAHGQEALLSAWPLPAGLALALGRVLRGNEDDVAQHYAAKTVENVATAGGQAALRLAVPEVAQPLLLLASGANGEHVRATAASALARLARAAPLAHIHACLCDGRPGGTPGKALAAGMADQSSRCAHAWLNLCTTALVVEAQAPSAAAAAAAAAISPRSASGSAPPWPAGPGSVADERAVFVALAGALERTSLGGAAAGASGGGWGAAFLRAKALLALALLVRRGGARALAAAAAARCVTFAERTPQEDEEPYCRCCGDALDAAVCAAAPGLLEGAMAEATRLASAAANGTPPGASLSPGSGGRSSVAPSPLSWLGAAAALLASRRFASSLLQPACASCPALLRHLPRLLSLADATPPFPAQAQLRAGAHSLLEALAQGSPALQQLASPRLAPAVAAALLPALAGAAGGAASGDTRFLALRAACDVLLPLLPLAFPAGAEAAAEGAAAEEVQQPGGGSPSAAAAAGGSSDDAAPAEAPLCAPLRRALRESLLPRAVAALGDPDAAVPLYALKLLATALDAAPELLPAAAALGVVRHAFSFLALEHACNNVHNVRLCLLLAACPEVPTCQLAALQAAHRAADVLSYAFEAGVEPFLEPALGVCRAVLERHAHEAATCGPGLDGQELLRCAQTFAALCAAGSPADAPVAELAADCLALLLDAFPGEAAAQVLSDEGACRLAGMLDHVAKQAEGPDAAQLASAHTAALGACGMALEAAATLPNPPAAALVRLLMPPLQRMQAAARDGQVGRAADAVAAAATVLLEGRLHA
jgi:serine/threonine-protein kinase ULK4